MVAVATSPMTSGRCSPDIRPIVSRADLAVCHLEVPLSRNGQDISAWPAFNAPPQLAAAALGRL